MQHSIDSLRILSERHLITPIDLINELPLSLLAAEMIKEARLSVTKILKGEDRRLLVIAGPCSIHDSEAALEYAHLLKKTADIYADDLLIIMRMYLEKPRTTIGWKGIISDPLLDGSFDINYGLKIARKMLLDINAIGLPTATEFLDTIIPQYLSDLITWVAIGARTAESQTHRELASGLSMPVGFKNTTDGNVKIAIDAVHAASHSHHFLGISKDGVTSILSTEGNKDCHIILRGSNTTSNYAAENVKEAAEALKNANLTPRLVVDCSHGNSMKEHERQALVVDSIVEQLTNGTTEICGVMLESNLVAGKQSHHRGENLTYGQSITDACMSWDETIPLLKKLARGVQSNRKV
jgi:3-deoxy-7-phosphoheptulonate synthase